MNGRIELGLGLALVASVALNWGFFAQHRAASEMPPLSLRLPLHSLRLLFTDQGWLSGYVIGLGGWGLYVAALAWAPLSLVQATAAGGIGVLALLVRWKVGKPLPPRDWAGVSIALTGLALLGISLAGGTAEGTSAEWTRVAWWIAGCGAIAWFAAGPGSRRLTAGAGAGIAAGLMYAAGDVATKASLGPLGNLAFVSAVLVCHLLGFAALQGGFQRGSALATAGIASLLNNAIPIAAGISLFGEPLGHGVSGGLRIAAFAAVVAGAGLLARPEGPGPDLGTQKAEPTPLVVSGEHRPVAGATLPLERRRDAS